MAQPDPAQNERQIIPTILTGVDGEPPTYVSVAVAPTPADALAFANSEYGGEVLRDDEEYEVTRVLMRELDPIACKVRGVDHPWWVECTTRARNPLPYWKIDG